MPMKIIRKMYNFVLIPFVFKNWWQVMAYVISSCMRYNRGFETFLLKDGQKINVRQSYIKDVGSIIEVYGRKVYSPPFMEIPDDSVIIDIGASIGDFSVFCGSTYKNAKIYSYEPDHEPFRMLKQNINLNNLGNQIVPCCLGVSGTQEQITIGSKQYGSMSIKDIINDNKINKCDLLKRDCEGMEYEILLSTPIEILKHIRSIVMECHVTDNGDELEKLRNYLIETGYNVSITKLTTHHVCYLYATRVHSSEEPEGLES